LTTKEKEIVNLKQDKMRKTEGLVLKKSPPTELQRRGFSHRDGLPRGGFVCN